MRYDVSFFSGLHLGKVEPEPLSAESERECKDEDSSSLGSGERPYQDKEEGNQKFSEKGECFSCMAAFNNFTKRRVSVFIYALFYDVHS